MPEGELLSMMVQRQCVREGRADVEEMAVAIQSNDIIDVVTIVRVGGL